MTVHTKSVLSFIDRSGKNKLPDGALDCIAVGMIEGITVGMIEGKDEAVQKKVFLKVS